MDALAQEAKEQNLSSIFVLTTVSAHWFLEKGFIEQSMEQLPEGKQKMYNYQRKSKIFIKHI
jgi:amino-acid N-acetyltransferase